MSTSTSFHKPFASQKVLGIPELVLLVIKDLAPRDLHSATLVCHTWSWIAIDYLWVTADSLAPLFNTLAPMHYSKEESNWTFVTDLSQANWPRFHAYARRIRTVKIYNPSNRWSQPVSMDSVKIVQASMPSGYRFPEPVRLLSYDSLASGSAARSLQNLLCIVSSAIKELHVVEYQYHRILPNLDDPPVQALFRRFGELEAPSLESITLKHPFSILNSPSLPNLINRHASTMHTLSINVPYNEQLWIVMRELHNLKDLSLGFEWFNRRQDMMAVLNEMTSGVFSKLEALSVYLQPANLRTKAQHAEVYRSIGRLAQLTFLRIKSVTPIMPYADLMEHAGQGLCQLETLCIDDGPVQVSFSTRRGTGSSLISILQRFPHIKRLNTSITCDSIPDTAHIKGHSFLEVLDLSWSPAPKARQEEVAGFLNSILPKTAQIVFGGEAGEFGLGAGQAAWSKIVNLMHQA
ncbi:hypothetical protein FRC01_000963 [Tulasnella sp. 417]|nr:hypothetical protein FRC01_000963 [Tulasnella sp. 417]